jgi:hypothetical protein
LRKGRDYAIKVATKLDDDPDPSLGSDAPEKAFAPGTRVRLSMGGIFDGQKDFRERIGHLRVPSHNMVPGAYRQFNTLAIGTAEQDASEHR